ncbi:MAG: TIGR03943 family protein [Spirochaetes bacterium]|nr:TIGR03943 family protein [Spirochaetota bacterium]
MENKNWSINLSALLKLFIIVFLCGGIFFLGNTGKLNLLINPRYIFLIVISMILLFLYIIFLLFSLPVKTGNIKINLLLLDSKYLAFIMIIILLITFNLIPDMDSYFAAASKLRKMNIIETKQQPQNDLLDSTTDIIPDDELLNKQMIHQDMSSDNEIIFTEDTYFRKLNDIHKKLDDYIGKQVKIKGFIYYLPDLASNYFVIARFLMICCAADSSIAGLICQKDSVQHDFEKDDWYEIEGIVKKESLTINGEIKILPILKIKQFKKIARMDNPYVYPIY